MVTESPLDPITEQRYDSPHLDVVTYNKNALNNLRRAVVLGQGQFSLILARANYQQLQQVLLKELSEHLQFTTIDLPPNTTRLRDAISRQLNNKGTGSPKQALMVCGLERIRNTEQLASLLKAANLGRDELPKTFDTPLVVWVNDNILQQLNRFAPDLKSFAATPIRFDYPIGTLVDTLRNQAEQAFQRVLGLGDTIACAIPYASEQRNDDKPCLRAEEIPFAMTFVEQQMEQQNPLIDNALLADLLFLEGRNLHGKEENERSRSYYESALNHWEKVAASEGSSSAGETVSVWDKRAVLLFYLGLWWRSQAVRRRSQYVEYCAQAKAQFEACLDIFRTHRPSRVKRFILALAEVLQKLKEWSALEAVAQEGLQLHQDDPVRLARDYGFLAEVAIAKHQQSHASEQIISEQTVSEQTVSKQNISEQIANAQSYAQKALSILEDMSSHRTLGDITRYHKGYYLYLLAITQQEQDHPATAIQTLERAKEYTDPRYDLTLHLNILNRLWHLYFEHKHYAQAFEIKLAQRRIESLFGLRAFIGAGPIQLPSTQTEEGLHPLQRLGERISDERIEDLGFNASESVVASPPDADSSTADGVASEIFNQQDVARILAAEIRASGRAQDISALVNRISQPRYPIVVLHGQSGVGKSSTISAGLVPQLRKLLSEGRTTHPITIASYGHWEKQIEIGLSSYVDSDYADDYALARSLTAKLRILTQEKYQQIVLIFDQFEEFFYEYPAIEQRKALYLFLRDCLEIPYVKVILALREDFLHYLLEWDRSADLSIINNDILSKELRYYLGNFSPNAAENVIRELTQSTGFHIAEDLIAALVDDLAADTGEVRPIELQVVGAQLQREKITTLADYKALGASPKMRLLRNFLDNVIRDCGPENSLVAQSVLFLLSEGDSRPLKSFSEIFSEIEEALSASSAGATPSALKLVLKILVGSGLLFEVPEVSGVRYQLVHEYLASLIQQQPPAALAESGLIEALKREQQRREDSEDQLKIALENQIAAESASQAKAAQTQVAEIRSLISSSRSRRLSYDGIGALTQALRAARQATAQPTDKKNNLLRMQIALCLDASLREIREKNRLSGHTNWVLAVDCSETMIVSASEDATLRLWTLDGAFVRSLQDPQHGGHQAGIVDVRFSSDGQYIASASLDYTVRIWRTDGECIHVIETPTASVTSISFSPNKPLLAATYSDAFIRVWNYLTGKEAHTWEGHEDWARTAAFSPSGEMIVTGGEDQVIRLWQESGEPVCSAESGQGWVRSVAWHPNGELIASGGDATTIKLWNRAGRKLKTLYGHEDWIRCVAFSPDGTKLASASDDQTIKVWGIEGTIQQTFHQRSSVHSLAWSRDSQTIISGGDDDLVHIWQLSGPTHALCKAHLGNVWSVSWHPSRTQVLSAGGDGTIKLWNEAGALMNTFEGHKKGVHSLTWSPQGDYFASASADCAICIWAASGKSMRMLIGHDASVWQVCYSPDGTKLASVSSDRTLRLWDVSTGRLLNTFAEHTDTVWHVSFSPTGSHLVTVSEDSTLRLWHVEKGLVQTIQNPHSGGVWCVRFSPKGDCVASGGADGWVKLWSVASDKQQIEIVKDPIILKGHRDWIRGLSFSADGEFLASSSDDGTVRLWAISQPISSDGGDEVEQMLPALKGHEGVVWDVRFDAGGRRLATAGADGTLRVWDFQLPSLTGQGCTWLSSWLSTRPELAQQICQ